MEGAERCRALIQRCAHHDKDERYMTISDLRGEIDSLSVIDSSIQTNMREAMLKRLDDSSSDVQQIAVNCFASMVEKFDPSQVMVIIGKLCNLSNIGNGSDLKEVYAEALRAVLDYVPWSLGEQVSNLLLPVLLGSLAKAPQPNGGRDRDDEQFWCLMLLQTVLERFVGNSIGDDHCENILSILLRLLNGVSDFGNSLVPSVVASFANFCPSHLLAALVQDIVARVALAGDEQGKLVVLVPTLAEIARKAGPRLVQFAARIVPVLELTAHSSDSVDFEDAKEQQVVIRYNSLVVLECLVRFGAQHVAAFAGRLLALASALVTLDPNFVESADDDPFMDEFDDDDWGLEPDVAPDEDAGDTTWKVRLAAWRLLSEWIVCRSFQLALVSSVPDLLDRIISRFDERDAAVQAQVLDTFSVLLQRLLDFASDLSIDDVAKRFLPQIVSRLRPQVMSPQLEVKRATAGALLALLRLFGIRMVDQTDDFLSLTLSEIADQADTSVLLIALDTLKATIAVLPDSRLRSMNVAIMLQRLLDVINAHSGTLSVSSFEILALLASRLSPGDDPAAKSPEMIRLFRPLFHIAGALPNDPSDVHASACLALAQLCSHSGSLRGFDVPAFASQFGSAVLVQGGLFPGSEFQECVDLFLSCVEIRNVELSGIQSLAILVDSHLQSVQLQLQPHAARIFGTLLDLVSGADRDATVVSAYLSTMAACAYRFPASIPSSLLDKCLRSCIGNDDSSIVPTMHSLCSTVVDLCRERQFRPGLDVQDALIDQSIRVVSKSDSQHWSLVLSSRALLVAISRLYSDQQCYELIRRLMDIGPGRDVPLAPLGSAIAACLVARFDPHRLVDEFAHFLSPIDASTDPGHLQLVLVMIGEVVRSSALPESFLAKLFLFLSSYITCGNDHIKTSAASSLGACTVASCATLLPSLLDLVAQAEVGSACFPLHALKEVLISVDPDQMSGVADAILPVLMKHADSDDEGVRAIASECIGKLLALNLNCVSPQIQSGLNSQSPLLRASVVTAVKFYYTQMRTEGVPAKSLLALLHDSDLAVKRQTFLAFVVLLDRAKSNANTIPDLDAIVDNLLTAAAREVQVRTELIRKIDFGAFQETVDEGLLLRQAAYSCLKTVTELFPDRTPAEAVILGLAKHGVNDPAVELQCIAYDIMSSIANSLPLGPSVGFCEDLPPCFLPEIKSRLAQVKRSPSDSDSRRVLSAFIMAVHKLHSLPGVKTDCPKFHTFYLQVLKTSVLADLLREHGFST